MEFKGLTYPKGFKVATAYAGMKSSGPDMLLLLADQPVTTLGMFTTNQMKASSVILGAESLEKSGHLAQAILVNSGNANAATGQQGAEDTQSLLDETAQLLNISKEHVLMSSTGIIGEPLPLPAMKTQLAQMVNHLQDQDIDSPQAILTTDTCTKAHSMTVNIAGQEVRISGIAKGSGMIHPNMATMLAYITTDVVIDSSLLQAIFKDCVEQSFHCITVDGDQSTNDTVLMMASGLAGHASLVDLQSEEAVLFKEALLTLMQQLAQDIVKDGEGATKFITVKVSGASTFEDAHTVALAIAKSSLVKTAMFGCDPNWGRIIAAAGSCGVDFDPLHVSLSLQDKLMFQHNELQASKESLQEEMKHTQITLHLDLGQGDAAAVCWTSDLSYDYVKINAEYHT